MENNNLKEHYKVVVNALKDTPRTVSHNSYNDNKTTIERYYNEVTNYMDINKLTDKDKDKLKEITDFLNSLAYD